MKVYITSRLSVNWPSVQSVHDTLDKAMESLSKLYPDLKDKWNQDEDIPNEWYLYPYEHGYINMKNITYRIIEMEVL